MEVIKDMSESIRGDEQPINKIENFRGEYRMKTMSRFIILTITAILCCGCRKQPLPVPTYPLNQTFVEEALNETELPWTLGETKESQELGITAFGLNNEEGILIASISSSGEAENRDFMISFTPPLYDYDGSGLKSLPLEDCEQVILLATILYGGFDNKHQVYKDYIKSDPSKITIQTPNKPTKIRGNAYQEFTEWTSKLNGIECTIRSGRPDTTSPQQYLNFIIFAIPKE